MKVPMERWEVCSIWQKFFQFVKGAFDDSAVT
jgi:hypothetical protein